MAGIYIHIPFCKTRCLYCDFFSNTQMSKKNNFIHALCREMENRKNYLNTSAVNTLYLGGGTPSQLSESDFIQIFDSLQRNFNLSECKEITIEANPDDLTAEYIRMLRQFPFNRISIGIQSFDNQDLQFLNRRHNAQRAIDAVRNCQKAGFNNISIDLMYGLPGQSIEKWQKNIDSALSLHIQHISSYHLIYEEGTALYRLLEQKKITPVSEECSLAMFQTLIHSLKEKGFIHYEISNFARPGYHSRHNSSYWTGEKYLGLGPGAHSFNGDCRHYNIGNLLQYIAGENELVEERLSEQEHFNDFVLTALRTVWGLSLNLVQTKFGAKYYNYCLKMAKKHLDNGNLILDNNILRLSEKGIFISDGIMSDFMYID